ncbi:toxin C-terminal domain-containing protein, partial [Streptomyces anulatus]
KIIKDPIGFLGNLVKAVGAGLNLFITNIADHLKTGVVSWLLGTAVKAGLDLPAKFDLKGIIQLIGSMLGLTWDNIRTRVTRKGVPDEAMSAVETSVPVAKNLAAEGPAGAVKEIQAEAGDLKATILGKLTTYLIPTVLIAGITWIISLLNPASAFVRAVKGIIDIVTFIVTQGAQIADFVNAVLDAVIAIANGGQAGVPKLIEAALASSVPLLIGFLAALLGIGGLANKVKSVLQSVSRPVTRAIDKIVDFIAKKGKALWAKLKGKSKNPESSKKDATKDKKLKPATVHFKMHGEAHRLIYRPPGTLIMASVPEIVLPKAVAALETAEKDPVAPEYHRTLLRQIIKKARDIMELEGYGFTQEDLLNDLTEFTGLCEAYGGASGRKDLDEEKLPDLPPLTELTPDRKTLKAQEGKRVTNTVATEIAGELGYEKISQRGKSSAVIYRNRSGDPEFISPDHGSGGTTAGAHLGGIFKGAQSVDGFGPSDRTGTYAIDVRVDGDKLIYIGLHRLGK